MYSITCLLQILLTSTFFSCPVSQILYYFDWIASFALGLLWKIYTGARLKLHPSLAFLLVSEVTLFRAAYFFDCYLGPDAVFALFAFKATDPESLNYSIRFFTVSKLKVLLCCSELSLSICRTSSANAE